MDNNNSNEKKINIDLPEDVAGGVYSNFAIIQHSASEFVCDFVQMMPGLPKGKVKSRIIMTPDNAKRLLHALQDNIRKYEEKANRNDGGPSGFPPINFGTPTTEA